jgi:hypothetical protein
MQEVTLFDFSGAQTTKEVPVEACLIKVGHKFYIRNEHHELQFVQMICFNLGE